MTLSDLSIRRPVFAWMLMLALMFFGVICFFQLGVSQLPEATPPELTIFVNWNGAAPEVMETEIVNPIEQAVISVQGVQDIESDMRQGIANIRLTFQTGKNIDAALQETNSKVRSVKLPDDVVPPTIEKINTDEDPIMWLAITSTKRSFKDMLTYVDLHLRDRQIAHAYGEAARPQALAVARRARDGRHEFGEIFAVVDAGIGIDERQNGQHAGELFISG